MPPKKGKVQPARAASRKKAAPSTPKKSPTQRTAAPPEPDDVQSAAREGIDPIVVGLGASAGGLEALQTFFANMPPSDTGMCFVVITHQRANRASVLPFLLQKCTTMDVVEAREGMRLEARHVYVAPPGQNLALIDGRLHLFEAERSAPLLPIDAFFRSLAGDQGKYAVGIVLSGTGSDGTMGLKEIKAALGLTIVARAGLYPISIAADISPKRLKRFFVQQEGGYQVRKEVREMLVFATQNLIEDPPFTKLDLMSCRNLLIYLDTGLQRRLFPIFHYVLKRGGLLFLGSSESVGSFSELFEQLDKKARIYRRKEVAGGSYVAEIPAAVPLDLGRLDGPPVAMLPRRAELGVTQMAERLLLKELVPPTVLMRERGDIVHIHGRTGLFLEPAPGPQTNANIYNMARDGLHLELAAAVRQASREGKEVTRRGVQVQANGHKIAIDVRVKRLVEPEPLKGLFRVTFDYPRRVESATVEGGDKKGDKRSSRVEELERELQYTKESHQSTIEELETANEELKSTNEELQSTNEELQSANEELETSKEELQSLNEELQTVNAELQGKVEELSRANDDMTNLLNATDIATIFLDNELNIKRHTEQAKRVIRLIPSDVGRSIGDLVSRLRYDALVDDAREVLRTLVFKEIEVQGEGDNNWYLMRILPYRTTENLIDGLVVTFVDITRVKELRQRERRIVQAIEHSPVCLFGVDHELRFTWVCGNVFGYRDGVLLGKTVAETLGSAQQPVTELIQQVLAAGAPQRRQLELSVLGPVQCFDVHVEPHESGQGSGVTCVAMQIRAE